ncbi:MAG: L,D-transpeptidase [Cyanobacteria bacterium]|nr:L,D-transpeptidase [Cyanobacteria bacterium bin.51]
MLPVQAQNKPAPAWEAVGASSAIPTAPPAVLPALVPGSTGTTQPEAIQPAPTPTAIAVPISNSRILLALGRREIRLERDGKIYGPWPVAIGDPKTPTPTGTFAVKNMVINPRYASTRTGKVNPTVGPNGPLGDRWIGFKTQGPDQFGIHGTPWPTWVDQRAAVTNGCVRMKHEHVRKLFDLVDIGTAVVITR